MPPMPPASRPLSCTRPSAPSRFPKWASFADIALSLPIIAALILMASSDEPRPGFNILAGVLIGASVALKLTNVVFAFGLVAAAIAAIRPLGALGCIALGGAISDPHRLSSLPRLFAMRGQRNVRNRYEAPTSRW